MVVALFTALALRLHTGQSGPAMVRVPALSTVHRLSNFLRSGSNPSSTSFAITAGDTIRDPLPLPLPWMVRRVVNEAVA